MTRSGCTFSFDIIEFLRHSDNQILHNITRSMLEINSGGRKPRRKKFIPKKKKNKLTIVFDENARREFLTGFHKRKLQRKNKAKEEFEKQLKAERKRIKAEAKEQYMKLLMSQKPIPELSDLVSENIDMGTHSVSITELSTADLARKNNWIGINEAQFQSQESEEEINDHESKNEDELEGMELKTKSNSSDNKTITASSCKEIKKKIKQQATANVKNSKIFKQKAKLEKMKNIKLKRKQERKLAKIKKKDKRSRHKNKKNNK